MQFGYDLAQERRLIGLDTACDFRDEFGANFAFLVAHGKALEHGGFRRGGKVQMFGHGHLTGLTEGFNSSELWPRQYPIGNTKRNAKDAPA